LAELYLEDRQFQPALNIITTLSREVKKIG